VILTAAPQAVPQPNRRSAAALEATTRAKEGVRERVWSTLEREGAARFPGARGRIPNFRGAEVAAGQLAELPQWRAARVVKANPDSPQLPVRRRALAEGKTVYMAVPRLREERAFVRLGGDATIKGAMREGRPVAIEDMEEVDLVVCGSVAVNRAGARVGKGGGYSDLELALLIEAGLVDEQAAIATTVHPLQVLEEELPETEHDFRVDLVVTPDEVLETGAQKRSPGILWHHLDERKIAAVPVLARLRASS
jgi:5-formyltetrahydrofolate cyclo-ligase